MLDTGNNQVYLTLTIKTKTEELDGFANRLDDTTELRRKIGWMLRRAYARRFNEGGPGWKTLADSTVADKMNAGMPPKAKNGKTFPRLVQNIAAPAASILIRSGGLRDSYVQKHHPNHISKVVETDDGFQCIEGSRDPKAPFHQEGTSPYMILPVNAKALRFTGSGGSVVFRQSVMHPGLAARPVTITTQEEKDIQEAVTMYLERPTVFHE